jgi:uncharacterized phage infection (PIP) family protein YhgE
MKSKLVLWGYDAAEAKVLVALQLRPEDNKVDVWTIPEAKVTTEFGNQLFHEWREGKEIEFPEGFTTPESYDLTASDSLLPNNIKVDKLDIVERAQTEWHFLVLSHKLHAAYRAELADITDRVGQLTDYSQAFWDELKGFWDKVRSQVAERNLLREQADVLRDEINELFTRLKGLRTSLDADFVKESDATYAKYSQELDEIISRIDQTENTAPIFEALKRIQTEFKEVRISRDLRSKIWEKTDEAFKKVKEKRFGAGAGNVGSTYEDRVKRRSDGLQQAIDRMKDSINRDKDELNIQTRKMKSNTIGQLELQILEAKCKMIETRVKSKEEKLSEMLQTADELEIQRSKPSPRREREKPAPVEKAAPAVIQEDAPTETPSTPTTDIEEDLKL